MNFNEILMNGTIAFLILLSIFDFSSSFFPKFFFFFLLLFLFFLLYISRTCYMYLDYFPLILQEGRKGWEETFLPKTLPRWYVKLLIKTGLFSLVFPNLTKYSNLTLKRAVDGLSSNKTLRMVLAYCFGDLGTLLLIENRSLGFAIRSDTINRPVQSQEQAKSLKFRI